MQSNATILYKNMILLFLTNFIVLLLQI